MRNNYDDETFFEQYAQMLRSQKGLEGAGERSELKKLLPKMEGKVLLDLGCGYGWHCAWAMDQGAQSALGLDISEHMLQVARTKNARKGVEYRQCGIEEYNYPEKSFDVVLSSLALHYIENLEPVFRNVYRTLREGGSFVLSMEHPVFTAQGPQDWMYDQQGRILCWPVDRYFLQGSREAVFLGCPVQKYHHTLTAIVNGLLDSGFCITRLVEPEPPASMMDLPGMKDELRRPMMLLIRAQKNKN